MTTDRTGLLRLFPYTTLLPNAIDQSLSEMRPLFAAVLKAATPADGADPGAQNSGERAEPQNGSDSAVAETSAAGAAAQTEPADVDETTSQ